ncbi:unnamed protein product [Ixodes hexagonus]
MRRRRTASVERSRMYAAALRMAVRSGSRSELIFTPCFLSFVANEVSCRISL